MKSRKAGVIWLLATVVTVALLSLGKVPLKEESPADPSAELVPYKVEERCVFRKPFGLEVGDEILELNNDRFTQPWRMLDHVHEALSSGRSITLNVRRKGKTFKVTRTRAQLEEADGEDRLIRK